jgi:pentatricopeptide repeat protein
MTRGSTKQSLKLLEQLAKGGNRVQHWNVRHTFPSPSGHLGAVSAAVEPLNVVLANWKVEFLQTPEKTLHPRQILKQVNELKSIGSTSSVARPDYRSYALILEAAAGAAEKSNSLGDIEFVDSLLKRLLEDSKTDFDLQLTAKSFAMVMNAWVKAANNGSSHKNIDAPGKVEGWIHRMSELHEEGWPDVEPNVVVYNILLNAYAKSGNVDKLEQTLQKMIRQEIPGVSPDPVSYSTLLSAYAQVATPESAASAESLLNQMLELYQHGIESAKPNVVSFTNVIQCFAQQGMGHEAGCLMRRIENLFAETQDEDWKPDLPMYNVVLMSNVNRPERAEDLLASMYQEKRAWFRPNRRSFNIVLSAWARKGDAERAESILKQMHEHHVSGELETKPDVVTYNTVLNAWAKKAAAGASSRQRNHDANVAWKRSKAILFHMGDLYNAGDDSVKPNVRTCNIVLNTCAKAGKIDDAEEMLEKFSSIASADSAPTIHTWNTLLSACMKRADVRRARSFWIRMKEAGVHPDIVSYNTLLNCAVRSSRKTDQYRHNADRHEKSGVETIFRELQLDPRVKPNRITYLAMINFWIRQGRLDFAGSFLLKLANQYCLSKDIVPPDRDLFHKILVSWAEYRTPKKAEALLLKMSELEDRRDLDLRPTVDTYNRVLNCWAKSMKAESGERADLILREMEALSNAGDLGASPDIYSYNAVLNAWSNSGDPTAVTRTDNLILEMILKGNPALMPDVVSYGTWLKTISASNETDKERRAKEVVKTMKIHNFNATEYLLQRIRILTNPIDS